MAMQVMVNCLFSEPSAMRISTVWGFACASLIIRLTSVCPHEPAGAVSVALTSPSTSTSAVPKLFTVRQPISSRLKVASNVSGSLPAFPKWQKFLPQTLPTGRFV